MNKPEGPSASSESAKFKDLFSRQSADYSKFRPTYPTELFEYLATLVDKRDLAWDVGTGNGQSAVMVANHFSRVVATDPSIKQIERATPNSRVIYHVGAAESSEFADHTVDLVTVAQAIHWFNHEKFFNEVRRVLKPKGVLAFWCYGGAQITPEVNAVVRKLYLDILGPYWQPERRLIEEGYRSIRVPMQEITPPDFSITADWELEHLIGYLGTWSALQSYIEKNKSNPLEAMYEQLRTAWGKISTHRVQWELNLRVARN